MSYRTTTRLALAYAALLVILSVVLLCVGMDASASAQGYSVHVRHASETATLACPNEDEAGWDWTTCGNGYRGIVDSWGNRRVVGVCEFVYRRAHGMVWYTRSERMFGDRHARRVCGGAFPDTLREARARDRGEEF